MLQKEIDAGGDKDYITFLTHLRDCFRNYFSTPTDKSVIPDIQWIDPQFALNYGPAQNALKDLKDKLFYDTAVEKLKEKLWEAGAFSNNQKDFYLWNTSPYNWDDMSYQSRPVQWRSKNSRKTIYNRLKSKLKERGFSAKFLMPNDLLPEQFGALGDFTINAIPEDYVVPAGNNKYYICINKMYYFINDSFNFGEF